MTDGPPPTLTPTAAHRDHLDRLRATLRSGDATGFCAIVADARSDTDTAVGALARTRLREMLGPTPDTHALVVVTVCAHQTLSRLIAPVAPGLTADHTRHLIGVLGAGVEQHAWTDQVLIYAVHFLAAFLRPPGRPTVVDTH